MKTNKVKDVERAKLLFLNRVHKTESCWLWKGSLNNLRGGYGYLKTNGVMYRAHRLAWLLFKGKVPRSLQVCHTCDVRACVNPDHLYLGSHEENIRDAVLRGRMASGKNHGLHKHPEARAFGERNGMAQFTSREAELIRQLAKSGKPSSQIAKEFHASYRAVHRIVNRESYTR